MRRRLIRLQQVAVKWSLYAFVCGLMVGIFGIAGVGLRQIAWRTSSPVHGLGLMAWGELALFAIMLWCAVDELNGRAAAFARSLPGGPWHRLKYLEPQLFPMRLSIGLGFAAFLIAVAGIKGMSEHGTLMRAAFGLVASWLAIDGALAVALLFGSGTGGVAAASMLTACLAIVHLVAASDPTLGTLAGATAWSPRAAALVPIHWGLRPATMPADQIPPLLHLIALTGVALAVRCALLGLMHTLFLDPARAQVGARRPAAGAPTVARDLGPRLTPPLPVRLWISARLMGWHGDAIVPRVISVTMLGFAALALVRFSVPRPETRGAAELAMLTGALTVIAAWMSVARLRAKFSAMVQGARLGRWARTYPAWALYPVGPWESACHQAALILGIAAACGLPLLFAGAALFPLVHVEEAGTGFLWMAGLVTAACGGIAIVDVLTKCTLSVQQRAIAPWRRTVRNVAIGVTTLAVLAIVISSSPLATALVFLAGGVGMLLATAWTAWRVDRAGGYDIIEQPQAVNQAHLHR